MKTTLFIALLILALVLGAGLLFYGCSKDEDNGDNGNGNGHENMDTLFFDNFESGVGLWTGHIEYAFCDSGLLHLFASYGGDSYVYVQSIRHFNLREYTSATLEYRFSFESYCGTVHCGCFVFVLDGSGLPFQRYEVNYLDWTTVTINCDEVCGWDNNLCIWMSSQDNIMSAYAFAHAYIDYVIFTARK